MRRDDGIAEDGGAGPAEPGWSTSRWCWPRSRTAARALPAAGDGAAVRPGPAAGGRRDGGAARPAPGLLPGAGRGGRPAPARAGPAPCGSSGWRRSTTTCGRRSTWCLATGDPEQGLRLVGALGWFWHRRGYLPEGHTRLEQALACAAGTAAAGATPARLQALIARARLAHSQGDYAGARALSEQSLALAQALGDRRARPGRSITRRWPAATGRSSPRRWPCSARPATAGAGERPDRRGPHRLANE